MKIICDNFWWIFVAILVSVLVLHSCQPEPAYLAPDNFVNVPK